MPSASLLDFFSGTKSASTKPEPDLALQASFGLQDIARLLRHNRELIRENDEMRSELRRIEADIRRWIAARDAIHGT